MINKKEKSEAYQTLGYVVTSPKPVKSEGRPTVERGGDLRGGKKK